MENDGETILTKLRDLQDMGCLVLGHLVAKHGFDADIAIMWARTLKRSGVNASHITAIADQPLNQKG